MSIKQKITFFLVVMWMHWSDSCLCNSTADYVSIRYGKHRRSLYFYIHVRAFVLAVVLLELVQTLSSIQKTLISTQMILVYAMSMQEEASASTRVHAFLLSHQAIAKAAISVLLLWRRTYNAYTLIDCYVRILAFSLMSTRFAQKYACLASVKSQIDSGLFSSHTKPLPKRR